MNKDEKTLRQLAGTENPFRVPENYFQQFTPQLMSRLPKRETPVIKMRPWWSRYRGAVAAAACFAAAIFSVGIYMKSSAPQAEPTTTAATYNTDNTIDQMADYVMMDNEAIYASLADY